MEIESDSFTGETFTGSVARIADAAEFKPRNVQLAERRALTGYAVKNGLPDPDGVLKSGMPTDVTFIP